MSSDFKSHAGHSDDTLRYTGFCCVFEDYLYVSFAQFRRQLSWLHSSSKLFLTFGRQQLKFLLSYCTSF